MFYFFSNYNDKYFYNRYLPISYAWLGTTKFENKKGVGENCQRHIRENTDNLQQQHEVSCNLNVFLLLIWWIFTIICFFDNTKVKHFFYLQNIIDIMFLVSIVYFFFRGIFLTYECKKNIVVVEVFHTKKTIV